MDKIILAQGAILDREVAAKIPNFNSIVFGGTGSGKTMSVFLPTWLHGKNDSFMGTFAKEEMVPDMKLYTQETGCKAYVWNLPNPSNGDPIPDPIAYLSTDNDVQEFCKQIAHSNPEYEHATKFDPYWLEAVEALMSGLIYYVFMTEDEPSMKKVIDLFYRLHIQEEGRAIKTSLDSEFDWLEIKAPESMAARKLSAFRMLPYSTAGCVRDSVEKSIQTMFPVSIQNAMSMEGAISFEDFATERTAIFIVTSPVDTNHYSFANMIMGIANRKLMIFARTREDHRLPRDVKFGFDDYSCGFPITNHPKLLATYRSIGCSSLMLCQSLAQLEKTYGKEANTILDNVSSIVYLPGGLSIETCEYIGRMIDLPANQLMFMEMGKAIVIQAGQKPRILPRYNIFDDPLYRIFVDIGKKRNREKMQLRNR